MSNEVRDRIVRVLAVIIFFGVLFGIPLLVAALSPEVNFWEMAYITLAGLTMASTAFGRSLNKEAKETVTTISN